MPTLVAIMADTTSRQVIRASLPTGWELHEASDGVQGLALVRHEANTIELLLVASELPDLDGRLVCLQLRTLCPTVPLIPIADAGGTVPFLIEIGCLPPLTHPLAVNDVRARITTARNLEAPPAPTAAFVQLVLGYAAAEEQRVRQEHCPCRVLVYATSPFMRAGISHFLDPSMAQSTCGQPTALRRMLSQFHYDALVAPAVDRAIVREVCQAHAIPLILIVSRTTPAAVVAATDVSGLVADHDPFAAVRLAHMLAAISHGESLNRLLPELEAGTVGLAFVPPLVARWFDATPVTRRELDLLWLDAQGWSSAQIARQLLIDRTTVTSYWKRVQRKLHRDRRGVRAWVREQVALANRRALTLEPVERIEAVTLLPVG